MVIQTSLDLDILTILNVASAGLKGTASWLSSTPAQASDIFERVVILGIEDKQKARVQWCSLGISIEPEDIEDFQIPYLISIPCGGSPSLCSDEFI